MNTVDCEAFALRLSRVRGPFRAAGFAQAHLAIPPGSRHQSRDSFLRSTSRHPRCRIACGIAPPHRVFGDHLPRASRRANRFGFRVFLPLFDKIAHEFPKKDPGSHGRTGPTDSVYRLLLSLSRFSSHNSMSHAVMPNRHPGSSRDDIKSNAPASNASVAKMPPRNLPLRATPKVGGLPCAENVRAIDLEHPPAAAKQQHAPRWRC